MKLLDRYDGSDSPFEGDLTLWLRGLPEDARIVTATIHLTPIDPSGGADPFTETITFTGSRADWGATKATGSDWVEVDFHARRTLAGVKGSGLNTATLQIDLGGAYVEINDRGAIKTPADMAFTLTGDEATLPGLTLNKFKLSGIGPGPDVQKVVLRSAPSNVGLHLGDLPPFWRHPGELTAPQSSNDFARVLQAYLADLQPENGYYAIPLRLHSDTIGRLSVSVSIDYLHMAALLPAGLGEVSLPFDYATVANTEAGLLQVALPANAKVAPGETGARVIGAFDDTRIVYGPLGAVADTVEIPVSPTATQAQPIGLSEALSATAVDLLLAAVTRSVQLQLDLREDLDGKPAGASLLTKNVTFTLDRQTAGQATWTSVPLPQEFLFGAAPASRYWLVIQSQEGEAVWSARPADAAAGPGLQNSNNGGLSWRVSKMPTAAAPLSGLFRLRRRPDRYQIPVVLEVGSGGGAQRIGLERFQPLGRVEFDLNLAEVAEAFNDYLAQATPTACLGAEHLADGAFDDWSRLGEELTAPAFAALQHRPLAIVVAPDGLLTYVAATNTSTTYLEIFQAASGTVRPPISLGSFIAPFFALSISPDGQRLYLLTLEAESRLAVFDAATGALQGEAFSIPDGEATGMALSPDGTRLYVAQYPYTGGENTGKIRVYATAQLGGKDTTGPDPLLTIDIGERVNPRAIRVASSESGSPYLYVLARDETAAQQCQVQRYETDHHTLAGAPLTVGKGGGALAVAPCGRRAVVANADATLNIIDLRQWKTEGAAMTLAAQPRALALAPDGERAYVVSRHDNDKSSTTLIAIDLDQRRQSGSLVLDGVARGIALSPQGDRLYLPLSGETDRLASVKTSSFAPIEWAVTAGRVAAACYPPPFGRVAVLGIAEAGEAPVATTLAQVTAVAGVCPSSYRFSFWGIATRLDAYAEVTWLDGECADLQSTRVAIKVLAAGTESGSPYSFPTASDLVPHTANLTPPAGATQAEVRFVTAAGIAVVDRVSLRATAEVTNNPELNLDAAGLPYQWTTDSDTADWDINAISGGVRLGNTSADSVALVQTVPITPERPFELDVQGYAVEVFSPDSLPEVGIRWSDSAGQPVGTEITLAISPQDFEHHAAAGSPPAQATQAEVHITLPPRTSLQISQVSLRQPAITPVPVAFLSQAPGELSVSQARVVFDLADTKLAEPPIGGLCHPRLPKPAQGTQSRHACFCGVCASVQEMVGTKPVKTHAGRPAEVGTCGACGSSVARLGGQLGPTAPVISSISRSLFARVRRPTPARIAAPTDRREKRTGVASLTRINGIGKSRAKELMDTGITSIRKLANLSPEQLKGIVKNISLKQAAVIIEEASCWHRSKIDQI